MLHYLMSNPEYKLWISGYTWWNDVSFATSPLELVNKHFKKYYTKEILEKME